jgi:hypothetical protein
VAARGAGAAGGGLHSDWTFAINDAFKRRGLQDRVCRLQGAVKRYNGPLIGTATRPDASTVGRACLKCDQP